MRKILMASAAILGTWSSLAVAQTSAVPANPSQGQYAAPYAGGASYNSNNNSWGVPNTPSGSAAAGGLSTYGALGQNFYAVPAPGTVVIRLNGRVEADMGVGSTSLNTYTTPGGVTYKQNPVFISSYMRLYPGFDGAATNGLHYGAQIELRENFQSAMNGSGSTAAPSIASPSVNTSAETIFVRRAYGYISADQFGIVRLGQGDGVIGLFDNCIFTSQCWDAGNGVFIGLGFGSVLPQNALGGGSVNYPWLAQGGAEYGNSKITYLSPQFYGFDFGVQYAPNEGNSYQDSSPLAGFPQSPGPASIATPTGGDALISTTTGNTSNRWYNQVGVGLRYEHTFGAVDVKTYGFYEHAAGEDANTYTIASPGSAAYLGASGNALHYDPLNFYQFGAAVTTAGLTAAVTYQGGRINNGLSLDTTGGASTSATIFGLTYANGPWVVGSTFGLIDSQGDANLTGVSQRHQFEAGIGGNYKIAPGVQAVLEYDYYQTHQGDFNFATSAVGGNAYNNLKGQDLFTSLVLTW